MDAWNGEFSGHRGVMSAAMFPARDRLESWREVFGRRFLRLDVEPLDDEPFRYDISYVALPGLNVSTGTISSVRCARTPDLIDDRNEDLILLIPQSGRMEVRERGKELALGAGDALVRWSSETGQTLSSRGEYLTLSIPREALAGHVGDIDRLGFAVLPQANPTLRLLNGYLRLLLDGSIQPSQADGDAERETAAMVARHVHEVAGLLLASTRDRWELAAAPGGGLHAFRLAAIHTEIARNATDPDFSVHDVARRLGISPGYVRKLLAARGERFSDRLRATRLDMACRALRTPHHATTPITAIALRSGFSDLSYFNRCFRQRFGRTPSEVRARAVTGGGDP